MRNSTWHRVAHATVGHAAESAGYRRVAGTRAAADRPPDDSKLNPPERVADAIVFALRQPEGCEVRELVIAHCEEGSWP